MFSSKYFLDLLKKNEGKKLKIADTTSTLVKRKILPKGNGREGEALSLLRRLGALEEKGKIRIKFIC